MWNRFSDIRFCPQCGVESIERDTYREEHLGEPSASGNTITKVDKSKPEYLCRICGFAFTITASLRHQHAVIYQKEHRKLRPDQT